MKTQIIALATGLALLAATPALAQFASGSGASGGSPNISGAGTGSSAPSTIRGASPGMSNPNAIASPAIGTPAPAIAPVQPIYPGVGSGGAGLPPAVVMPPTAHATHGSSATPH